VTNEFRHKTLTPTFLATPRRGIALGGKLAAGVVMGVLYAAVALVAAVGIGAAALAAFGIDTRLGETDTWAMIGRIVASFVLWTLIGVGVGTLVRNQVAAVVGVLAFTQFLEPIARTVATLVDGVSGVTAYLPARHRTPLSAPASTRRWGRRGRTPRMVGRRRGAAGVRRRVPRSRLPDELAPRRRLIGRQESASSTTSDASSPSSRNAWTRATP
jgi:hypothetical protein